MDSQEIRAKYDDFDIPATVTLSRSVYRLYKEAFAILDH